MARRILLVDDSRAVLRALRRDLEERGRAVDHAPALTAAVAVEPGAYGAAVVRASERTADLAAALRRADPLLPVLGLVLEGDASRGAEALGVDAVLVGPVTASAVSCACELAERLRDQAERIATLEARASRRGAAERDLAFLRKLLLVEVRRSRRYGFPVALALVGVDRLGAPGLSGRGRAAALGDVLAVVTRSLRDIDLAVPLDDDRIVVLMPHTRADGAMRVARRLAAAVRDRPGSPSLTLSVGVAAHGGDGTVSFGGLVKRAGDALARARAAGGDRVEAADPPRKRERVSIG